MRGDLLLRRWNRKLFLEFISKRARESLVRAISLDIVPELCIYCQVGFSKHQKNLVRERHILVKCDVVRSD